LVERLVYFKVFYFLLLLVPVSFVFPALWRATQAAIAARRSKSVIGEWSQRTWLGAAVATVGILSFNAACLPGTSLPAPLRAIGAAAPLAVAALGVVGGVLLLRVSRPSAVLAGASGFALFMGMTSLQSTMFGSAVLAPAIHFPRGGFFLLCAIVFVLLVHLGADLFRLSVAAAFSYLALQAMRNLNLFGFVAGVLLSANANEWIMQMDAAPASFSLLSARWPRLGRAAVALVLAACLAFVPTTAFREWTGDTHRFGWNERPLAFPHDAAKFAGAPDLPTHALVYDLGLASVFLYHNCPPKKVFMDPRLEVPSTETFREYFVIDELLEAHDGRWAEYVKRLDVPLILLDHDQHSSSEMTMLSEDGWRCVYFDALAAAYVSDGSASATKYPSVDFGRRHFQENRHPSTPGGSQAEFYEAKALTRIASQFRQSTSATWHWRVPMLLHAVDRLDLAEQVADLPERLWTLRGQCYWNLVADLSIRPRSPAEGWSAPASILWAQSTWCLRQALIHDPQHVPALRSLYDSWRVRGMPDAQFAVGRQLEVMHSVSPRQHQELDELARMLSDLETGREMVGDQDVSSLISRGCVATAAQWLKAGKTDVGKWTWEHVDRLAAAWMHLGEPVEARNIWRSAEQAVSEPERLARIADTYLVERDFANAEELYRKSLEGNSRLAAAWWGLAMMFAQQGNAAALFDACEQGLSCELTPAERAELSELKSLAGRYR
ncbi:MAG TPA: hypothetical protein VFE62_21390, partial [Gemmataceae bacterium]|nr:hypothetical protein [Gemmataceae bacterium]